jgi:hypothetical protein
MTAFALGGFATEGVTTAPKLTAHLALVNGQLKGTVENHSNLTFTDGVLIAGDNFQTIGALKPGASATVSLTPKASASQGQPLYMRIYNQSGQYYGPGGPNVTAADRDNFAKGQILSLLPTGVGFKGMGTGSAAPMLVVWTHQSFQDLSVNGTHPRSTSFGAVVLSLAVDQIGTGPLPTGIVSGRIVDVVGDTQSQGPPGMLLMQNGSVTYEFAPALTRGHLTGLSVNASNPYGPKFGPPGNTTQTGPAVTGEVWNWSNAAWTSVAYQDNGTTALPDGAAEPSTGLIRLRLSTTNGGLLAGSISLAGTVQ